jgi:hypothetical protein
MVYAGKVGANKRSFGVSGRLLTDKLGNRNLIMWDPETNSLWSQLLGEALHGAAKGKQLTLMPAVFIPWAAWKRLHPKTLVLDASRVRATSWHFTGRDLELGAVRGRRGTKAIGIGLRSDQDTLLVPMRSLSKSPVITDQLGKKPVLVVWLAGERSVYAYASRLELEAMEIELDGTELVAGGQRWDARRGHAMTKNTPRLPRLGYVPTYVRVRQAYYPEGRVAK